MYMFGCFESLHIGFRSECVERYISSDMRLVCVRVSKQHVQRYSKVWESKPSLFWTPAKEPILLLCIP